MRLRDTELAALLGRSDIWFADGTTVASSDVLQSGHAELDELLPGGGWPACGLVEFLPQRHGVGELSLVMPLLAGFSRDELHEERFVWIAPPYEPYAPALAARGVDLARVLIVRTRQVLWAMEQALDSGACRIVLAWVGEADLRGLRRLQLTALRSRTLAVIIRHVRYRFQPSPAMLRLVITPAASGIRVELIKSRGGRPGQCWISRDEIHRERGERGQETVR